MKQIARIVIFKGIGGLSVVGLHALLTRQLGEHGYGIFVLFHGTLAIVAILANGGWMHGVVVLATRYSIRQRWSRYLAVIRQAYLTSFVFPVLVSIPLYFVAPVFFGEAAQISAFRMGLIAAPAFALIFVEKGVLRSLQRPDLSILPDETLLPMCMIAVLLALQISAHTQAIVWYALIGSLISAATLALTFRLLPERSREAPPQHLSVPWTTFTLPMVAGEIGNIVISRSDILMISALSTPQQTGAYSMAIRLASLLLLVHTVLWPVLSGQFSQAHARRDRAESRKLLLRATLLAGGFALVPASILVFVPQVTTIIFGPAGESAIWPMRMLAAAYLIHAATGPLGLLMTMQGMHKDYSATAWIAAVVNVLLNLLLVPHYGASGAALTTLVTFVVWKAILIVRIWKAWRDAPPGLPIPPP